MISASKLHIKLFQFACKTKTSEIIDTPKGKAGLRKALVKSCKIFLKKILIPRKKSNEGNNENI